MLGGSDETSYQGQKDILIDIIALLRNESTKVKCVLNVLVRDPPSPACMPSTVITACLLVCVVLSSHLRMICHEVRVDRDPPQL
jgi:hypothetical protein